MDSCQWILQATHVLKLIVTVFAMTLVLLVTGATWDFSMFCGLSIIHRRGYVGLKIIFPQVA